jgi:hypothetical protein
MGGSKMRVAGMIAGLLVLMLASPASAQVWGEFVSREDAFLVNFPGDPVKTEKPYKTAKGTQLTAHVYEAKAAPDSIFAGTYRMTVVDYAKAGGEIGTAVEEAAATFRKLGTPKYDDRGNIDRIRSQRQTIDTADGARIMTEILVEGGKLYIVEANVSQKLPPPAQFQASVQILDKDGNRIRYEQDGVTRVAR